MNTLAVSQADLRRMFQAGNVRYLIMGINLLLVVWIAAELAALTWGVLRPAAEDAPVATVQRQVPAAADPGRQLIARLPDWHLMGEATSTANPVKTAVPTEAPDTRLKLTLRGALSSDDPSGGHAIIADEKGKDERYSIGDKLPGNAELSEIFSDKVILQRNGRYETLRLPEFTNKSGRVTGQARPGSRTRQAARSPENRLSAIREQIKKNPASTQGMLNVVPHEDASGRVVGYKVSPGSNPALFTDTGLQRGDVVMQVNGLDLGVPANSAKALQILQSDEPINMVIMRNGVQQSLSLGGS